DSGYIHYLLNIGSFNTFSTSWKNKFPDLNNLNNSGYHNVVVARNECSPRFDFNTQTLCHNNRAFFMTETFGCRFSVGSDSFDLNPTKITFYNLSYPSAGYSHFNYILGELDPMTGGVLWAKSIHNNDSNNRINVKD